MSIALLVPSLRTERETQLYNLRALAPVLGLALKGGNRRHIYRTLRSLGQVVSIRAHEAPSIKKPNFDAIREVYHHTLRAIDGNDLYTARAAVSEMLDLAGLF